MGGVGGAVGGFMMGGAMGGSIVDIARNALDPEKIPTSKPPKDSAGTGSHVGSGPTSIDVNEFFKPKADGAAGASRRKCPKCGSDLPEDAKFCLNCGERVPADEDTVICPECGKRIPKVKFCPECGHKFGNTCPSCGAALADGAKFCTECGTKL